MASAVATVMQACGFNGVQAAVVGQPGLALSAPRLDSVDLRCACCRVWPISSRPFSSRVLAKRVDVEVDFLAVRPHHDLALQIDGDARVAAQFGVVDQVGRRPRAAGGSAGCRS